MSPVRPVVFTGDIFRQQPRGGISRYVVEVANRLARPCEVVAGAHQSAELERLRVPARGAIRLPAWRGVHRLAAPLNAMVDARWLASRRGVIVHPTYFREASGLPNGEPLVVTVYDMTHERLPGEFPPAPRDPATHKAALCRRADRVLCISESTRADVLEFMKLPPDRVRVTPLAGREFADVTPVAVRGVTGPFVLWVGERHAYKNFARALAAWAGAPAASGTQLLCVGGGPWRPREREAIAALGVDARVLQRSCTDGELRWAYENARALVYASLWEGFGVPLIEALSLGCPVLASDRAPFREVAGDAATYAEPTDVDALKAGLAGALAAGRAPDAVAARRARAALFSWDTCAARHEAVYRELD